MPDEALGIEDMSVSQWLDVEMARRRKIGFQFGVSGSGTGGCFWEIGSYLCLVVGICVEMELVTLM
jgi:hypothetical protein